MVHDEIIVGLFAIIPAFVTGVWAKPIAGWLGLFDCPDGARKLHARPTPLVGGLMLLAGMTAACLAREALSGGLDAYMVVVLAASALALSVGIVDDRWQIPPLVRLVLLGVIATAAMLLEPAFVVHVLHSGLFDFHQGLGVLSFPLTVIAVLALVNALNMTDGVDGLFPSLSLCYLALLAPWVLAAPGVSSSIPLALVGALACILAFNAKGRLFMGDSGTYAIAVFLGLMAVYLYNQSTARLPGELVALWFGVPVTDMIRLFAQRMFAGRSPFSPDRNHLHHRLQRILPDWGVVAAYCALIAVPGLVVGTATALLPLGVSLGLASYALAILLSRRRTVRPRYAPERDRRSADRSGAATTSLWTWKWGRRPGPEQAQHSKRPPAPTR